MNPLRLAIFTLATSALVAGGVASRAAASPAGDVTAVVRKFVDAFNSNDMKTAFALCANPVSIIDEFPPHEWQGPKACQQWAADFDADAKKNGITDELVTMDAPWTADVTGDRGYVVAPVTYAFKQRGAPVKELHSVFTVSLKKSAGGWLITGWAWSKH